MALSNKEKEDDLADTFAAHALSGYIRDGLSILNGEAEAKALSEGCYIIAYAMLDERKRRLRLTETL